MQPILETRAHKRGRSRMQIAQEVGLSYTAVSQTIKRFECMGWLV